jgi:hypothetical protein
MDTLVLISKSEILVDWGPLWVIDDDVGGDDGDGVYEGGGGIGRMGMFGRGGS